VVAGSSAPSGWRRLSGAGRCTGRRGILVLIALLLVPAGALAAPCSPAAISPAACAEWIVFGSGPNRSLVYTSAPLEVPNPEVRHALVIVHDFRRNAFDFFRTGMAGALLAGRLDDTLVVAPRFASHGEGGCDDDLAPDEVNWPCEGVSWRAGGTAADGKLTSFDFADEILRRLANKRVFPNLASIVVAGHSAGGQFVTRYEMANQVHDRLGVPVSYVVANPSSYAYPDPGRPVATRGCFGYDQWPYGLQHRTGYAAGESVEALRRQLAGRPTTYLLGTLDVLRNEGFDGSCSAMAQGATRLARGKAFAAHIRRRLGAKPTVVLVPLCGHNARCMLTADPALPVLFPK
jgi:pimeloyl-ACP methyl ester carboxylesterase